MNTILKIMLTIMIFYVAASTSFAQSYTDLIRLGEPGLGSDARSLGMGNAFVGVADNFSAIISNPAGLAQIKEGSLSIGIKDQVTRDSALFRGDIRTKSANKFAFSQLGIVSPYPVARGSLVFAFGYSSEKTFKREYEFESFNRGSSMIEDLTYYGDDIPYFLGLSNPVYGGNGDYLYDETVINGNLTQSGKTTENGHLYSWSGACAWEAAKNLYVGLTINYKNGWFNSDRTYYEDDWDNFYGYNVLTNPEDPNTADFETFYLNDVIEQDFSGWDAKLGFLYNPNNFIRVGGTIKFPTKYTIREKYSYNAESWFGTGTIYFIDEPAINDFEYDVKTPYEFSAGISADLSNLLLSGQITYIDYTTMEFTGGMDQEELYNKNLAIKDNLHETVNVNLGGEFSLPYLHTKVRAGFIYQQSPYDGDDFDYDKKYVTLGGSIGVDTDFQLDLTYAYGWWRDYTDNYGSGQSTVEHYYDYHNLFLTGKFAF